MPSGLLTAIATGQPPTDAPPFVRTWYQDYDYLYVLGPPAANPLPDLLDVLDVSGRFVLNKIRRRSQSMIGKSARRFSLATNAERVCAEIMLKQQPEAR